MSQIDYLLADAFLKENIEPFCNKLLYPALFPKENEKLDISGIPKESLFKLCAKLIKTYEVCTSIEQTFVLQGPPNSDPKIHNEDVKKAWLFRFKDRPIMLAVKLIAQTRLNVINRGIGILTKEELASVPFKEILDKTVADLTHNIILSTLDKEKTALLNDAVEKERKGKRKITDYKFIAPITKRDLVKMRIDYDAKENPCPLYVEYAKMDNTIVKTIWGAPDDDLVIDDVILIRDPEKYKPFIGLNIKSFPPNEKCYCGKDAKYKKCCGSN